MPRSARIVFPDVPYHLTQRGVNRQPVFLHDDEICFTWISFAHFGGGDSSGLLDLSHWSKGWPGDTWQEYLQDPEADDDMPGLRRWTQSGRPLGDDDLSGWKRKLVVGSILCPSADLGRRLW